MDLSHGIHGILGHGSWKTNGLITGYMAQAKSGVRLPTSRQCTWKQDRQTDTQTDRHSLTQPAVSRHSGELKKTSSIKWESST
ncbi:hypothetical protein FKM82_021313 [Ascaphus truei]